MTDDRDERQVQAIAGALREAIKRGTRAEVLEPFAEAILFEELDHPDDDEPAAARELVGAGAIDEHFFG